MLGTNGINLPRFNNLKSAIPIIFIIRRSRQRRPDPRVDVGIVPQQTLHGSVVKVRAVVYRGDFAGRTTEDFRFPRVAAFLASNKQYTPMHG